MPTPADRARTSTPPPADTHARPRSLRRRAARVVTAGLVAFGTLFGPTIAPGTAGSFGALVGPTIAPGTFGTLGALGVPGVLGRMPVAHAADGYRGFVSVDPAKLASGGRGEINQFNADVGGKNVTCVFSRFGKVGCTATAPETVPDLSEMKGSGYEIYSGRPGSVATSGSEATKFDGLYWGTMEGGPPSKLKLRPGEMVSTEGGACQLVSADRLECTGKGLSFAVVGAEHTVEQDFTLAARPADGVVAPAAADAPSDAVGPNTTCGTADYAATSDASGPAGPPWLTVDSGAVDCATAEQVMKSHFAEPSGRNVEAGWSCARDEGGDQAGRSASCSTESGLRVSTRH